MHEQISRKCSLQLVREPAQYIEQEVGGLDVWQQHFVTLVHVS